MAVAEFVPAEDLEQGILMPRVETLKDVSAAVAYNVGLAAIGEGISGPCAFSEFKYDNNQERLKVLLENMRWEPQYLPLVPV
jgi:hypothetical protein